MRVTLEREDLLAILGKALGYELHEDDVTITADPFEVHIKKVPVDELSQKAETPKPATTEPSIMSDQTSGEEFLEENSDEVDAVMTMEQVLAQSHSIAQDGSRTVGETPGPLTRPLGPAESEEPPPVTDEELAAITRIAQS